MLPLPRSHGPFYFPVVIQLFNYLPIRAGYSVHSSEVLVCVIASMDTIKYIVETASLILVSVSYSVFVHLWLICMLKGDGDARSTQTLTIYYSRMYPQSLPVPQLNGR